MKFLLGTGVGTSVHTNAWSFALPETGGTHDEFQTDWRGRGHFYCTRGTRDGSAHRSPAGTTNREHLLRND
jgi:hypothetical protein